MPDDPAERLAEIVKSAIECGPEGWAAFLDEECRSDPAMRAEVESLLKHQEAVDEFIEKPALHLAAESFVREGGAYRAGQIIGDYEILSLIGSGGMGEVYLAQDRRLNRKVALKFVRRGMNSDDILRRFTHEERLLASLNHPNISQLYGSGVTDDGIPFFAMEHVDSERLDQYCNERRLATDERLQLFRKVCAAVTYAHQHLVIHRDIKPANIRVTAEGEPKLLDFGIAKLLDTENGSGQTLTLPGVMTPEYASPEQVRGETMTTASDVYSLGVVLYELLTGQKPYKIDNRTPANVARAIAEQEPTRPSTAARNQQSEFRNQKSLRGDLDNIVLMAMRKEPARRYSSVAQFSSDIRRHLEGLPVIARKDTLRYRSEKFIQRHKVAVAAAAVVFLTLIGGIFATAWQAKKALAQARIAAEQRDRAQKQAAKAERVTTFMQNVLGFSDPSWNSSNPHRNREATISAAMVEAGRRAETELANEPEALAAVHFTIGNTYRTQSRLPEAEPHLRAALEIRRRVLGPNNPETGQSMVTMAEWFLVSGRYPEAEPLYRDAIPIFRANHDAKWLSIALNDSGTLKWFAGEHVAAEKFLREALNVSAEFVGAERAPRAVMYNTLGLARRDQGDLAQGAEFLQKAIDEHRALPGEARSELALALSNLASIVLLQGDYERAESLSHEAFELFRKTLGENHQYSAYPLITLAEIYYRSQNYPKARETIERAAQIQQRALPAEHIDFVRSRVTLGKIIMQTGEFEKAESYIRQAVEKLVQSLPKGHLMIAGAQGPFGECLLLQKRYAEAEPLLIESHNAFEKRLGPKDPRTQDACRRLVRLYETWGKPDEAARYRVF
jgi:eukaryotic-like serine/threonine-protein kinase